MNFWCDGTFEGSLCKKRLNNITHSINLSVIALFQLCHSEKSGLSDPSSGRFIFQILLQVRDLALFKMLRIIYNRHIQICLLINILVARFFDLHLSMITYKLGRCTALSKHVKRFCEHQNLCRCESI